MDHNEYLHVIETCKKFGCVNLRALLLTETDDCGGNGK